jgi:uncharacterized protein YmfQ (DUF2313 family)
MILAIDFDGVVHDHKHPIAGRRMGAPIEGAKEALTMLKRHHKIIIHSVWGGSGKQVIADWMKYYGIPYDDITNIKPQADHYIDDKAIHFTNWEAVRGIIQ